jgi:HK97 gp10 family phage protein
LVESHINGVDRFEQRLNGLADEIALQIADAVAAEIQAGWSAQSPSAPEEAPAVVLGTLAGSITLESPADGTARIGSDAAYAPLLEFGTVEMAARPWMRPAVERVRGQLLQIVRRAVLWTR